MTTNSSSWSWTLNAAAVGAARRFGDDRALQDALIGWTGIPDDLTQRMSAGWDAGEDCEVPLSA